MTDHVHLLKLPELPTCFKIASIVDDTANGTLGSSFPLLWLHQDDLKELNSQLELSGSTHIYKTGSLVVILPTDPVILKQRKYPAVIVKLVVHSQNDRYLVGKDNKDRFPSKAISSPRKISQHSLDAQPFQIHLKDRKLIEFDSKKINASHINEKSARKLDRGECILSIASATCLGISTPLNDHLGLGHEENGEKYQTQSFIQLWSLWQELRSPGYPMMGLARKIQLSRKPKVFAMDQSWHSTNPYQNAISIDQHYLAAQSLDIKNDCDFLNRFQSRAMIQCGLLEDCILQPENWIVISWLNRIEYLYIVSIDGNYQINDEKNWENIEFRATKISHSPQWGKKVQFIPIAMPHLNLNDPFQRLDHEDIIIYRPCIVDDQTKVEFVPWKEEYQWKKEDDVEIESDHVPIETIQLDPEGKKSSHPLKIGSVPFEHASSATRREKKDLLPYTKLEQWRSLVKDEVGSYDDIIDTITEIISTALDLSGQYFDHLSSHLNYFPKHFLLQGVSGIGKTYLACSLAKHLSLPYLFLQASRIFQQDEGESEKLISEFFSKGSDLAPAMLVIDDIQNIATRYDKMDGPVERRVLNNLIHELDRLDGEKRVVFVIATCLDSHQLEPSLFRTHRLEHISTLRFPTPNQRLLILERIGRHLNIECSETKIFWKELAAKSHGLIASDLEQLCKNAFLRAWHRINPSLENVNRTLMDDSIQDSPKDVQSFIQQEGKNLDVDQPRFIELKMDDFDFELTRLRSSSTLIECGSTYQITQFDELAGMDDLIAELKTVVLSSLFLYQTRDDLFSLNLFNTNTNHILLYGPSGAGKSKLVMALATIAKVNFLSLSGASIISKVVGQSEALVSQLFFKARSSAPCIVFIDQLEVLAQIRGNDSSEEQSADRLLSLILCEMDGIMNDFHEKMPAMIIIGATNRPDLIDPALLRPGRFNQILFVPPPNQLSRAAILKKYASRTPIRDWSEEKIWDLSKRTKGYTGADIKNIFTEAVLTRLEKDIKSEEIEMADIEAAMANIQVGHQPILMKHPHHVVKKYEYN